MIEATTTLTRAGLLPTLCTPVFTIVLGVLVSALPGAGLS